MKPVHNILVLLFVVIALIIVLRFAPEKCKYPETYEPQNMGSRRYWGFGRENAYSIHDHYEDHGSCFPASQMESGCPAGYVFHKNESTGQLECCVNSMNY